MSYANSAPIQAVGGGSPTPAYQLITGWGSLNDADAQADTGSGMSAGTWTIVTKVAYTTQVDGFQESFSGYDIPLTTLYPDWSDATDRLDLCLELAAMPLTTAKWGFSAFVGDQAYASRASMIGKGVVIYPNSASITQTAEAGATAPAGAVNNGTNLNVVSQVYASLTWDSGRIPRVIGRTKRTTDEQELTLVASPGSAMGVVATRRIYLAALHVSAVGGTVTASARLYARRLRTSGPFV